MSLNNNATRLYTVSSEDADWEDLIHFTCFFGFAPKCWRVSLWTRVKTSRVSSTICWRSFNRTLTHNGRSSNTRCLRASHWIWATKTVPFKGGSRGRLGILLCYESAQYIVVAARDRLSYRFVCPLSLTIVVMVKFYVFKLL